MKKLIFLLLILSSCSSFQNYKEVVDPDIGYTIRYKDTGFIQESFFGIMDERFRLVRENNAIRFIAKKSDYNLKDFEIQYLLDAKLIKYKEGRNKVFRIYKHTNSSQYFLLSVIQGENYELYILENSTSEEEFLSLDIVKKSTFP